MHKYFLISIQFILISFKAHTVETKLDDLPTEIIAYITGSLPIADCAALRQTNKRNSQIVTEHALKKRFLNEKIIEINKAKELICQYMKLYGMAMMGTGIVCDVVSVFEKYQENSPQIDRILENILDSPIATSYLVQMCKGFSSIYKKQKGFGQLPPRKLLDTPKDRRKENSTQSLGNSSNFWFQHFGVSIAAYYKSHSED